MKVKISIDKVETLFDVLKLEEHSLYKVLVKVRANNPSHISYLFTGFRNGNYCEVYQNSYDSPINLQDLYSIEIIKKLDSKKD